MSRIRSRDTKPELIGEEVAVESRVSVPPALPRSTRKTGHSLSRPQEGHFREWLLLAQTRLQVLQMAGVQC